MIGQHLVLALTLGLLGGRAALADGIDCARAANALDRAVCASPDLRASDTTIGQEYGVAHDATAGATRAALVAGQRAWLVRRARQCPTAAASCLGPVYGARAAFLRSLTARIENGDPELHSLDAPALQGRYTVTGYRVPQAPGRPVTEDAVPRFLPRLGAAILATPGLLCSPPDQCLAFGLNRTTIGTLAADNPAFAALGLAPGATAYDAVRGNYAWYDLVPLPDGTLLASFDLCRPGAHDCVTAFQVWRPASRDARIDDLAKD